MTHNAENDAPRHTLAACDEGACAYCLSYVDTPDDAPAYQDAYEWTPVTPRVFPPEVGQS